MAININHPNDPNGRVDAPEVQIAGKEVNTTDGTLDAITRIYSRDHQRVIGGSATQKTAKDVDHRASDAFARSVTVTINPDAIKGLNNNQATWRKAVEDRESNDNNVFYGEQPGGLEQNATMYTYYTLNGKDPSRTKAELYTGPFTVRQNKSGGDNYVLKTRSYINGIASPVRRVDFRIVELKSGNKQVNKLTIDASAI
jgi:hypothetical protein